MIAPDEARLAARAGIAHPRPEEDVPSLRHIPEVGTSAYDVRRVAGLVVNALGGRDRSTPFTILKDALTAELVTLDLVIKELEHRDEFGLLDLVLVLQASRNRLDLACECSDSLATICASEGRAAGKVKRPKK